MKQIETERKFIIEKPDFAALSLISGYTRSKITQIYLKSDDVRTHRIRRRKYGSVTEYTENFKLRISKESVIEEECEISEERYLALMADIDGGCTPLEKIRHTVEYDGKIFEIDEYPFWHRTAVMEVELASEDERIELPPFLQVVREVTGLKEYSNHSMSKRVPCEIYL